MISKDEFIEAHRDHFFGLMCDLIYTEARGDPLAMKMRGKIAAIERRLREIYDTFNPEKPIPPEGVRTPGKPPGAR